MKSLYILLFFSFTSLFSCNGDEKVNETIEILQQFSQVQDIIDKNPGNVKVINFWATSCPPCLKEMPHFIELDNHFKGKNFDVLLVSLDRAKDLEKRVIPFVKKYKITPEVVLLGDNNYSAWTAKIDESWYGALPATLIIKGDKKVFKFGSYTDYDSLLKDVEQVLNFD